MGLLVLQNSIAISTKLTYNKVEKLKSRKLIDALFSKGKSVSAFPIKALYNFVEDGAAPLQAGVTASSRSFKKAVQRNRVKRVLREAYRLQKLPLQNALQASGKSLVVFFIYLGKELPVYTEVYEKMGIILERIADNVINKPNKI